MTNANNPEIMHSDQLTLETQDKKESGNDIGTSLPTYYYVGTYLCLPHGTVHIMSLLSLRSDSYVGT